MKKCFLCGKNDKRIMLLEMPVETIYLGHIVHIIGNANPNEYICLSCVGYQFDAILKERVG